MLLARRSIDIFYENFSLQCMDDFILFCFKVIPVQWFRSSVTGQYTTLNIVVVIIIIFFTAHGFIEPRLKTEIKTNKNLYKNKLKVEIKVSQCQGVTRRQRYLENIWRCISAVSLTASAKEMMIHDYHP